MPYSFDFVSIYTLRPGRKPELTTFKFIPVYRPEFDENNDFRPVDSEQAEERPFSDRQEKILFGDFGLTHECQYESQTAHTCSQNRGCTPCGHCPNCCARKLRCTVTGPILD